MDIAKYALFLFSSLLTFSSTWLFSFTETVEGSGRRRLTKAGKIGLPVAVCLFAGAFAMFILDDRNKAGVARVAARNLEMTAQKLEETTQTLEKSRQQLDKLSQITLLSVAPRTPARESQIAKLVAEIRIEEPSGLNAKLKNALATLERTLGGRQAQLDALARVGVAVPADKDNVLMVAVVGLQNFGVSRRNEQHSITNTREAVQRLLRGLDADIVAVQEIASFSAFQELLEELPQYGWVYGGSDPMYTQAVLFRRDRITQLGAPKLLGDGERVFARKPIVMRFGAWGNELEVLSVHLKSQYGEDRGVPRREREAKRIAIWLQQRRPRPLILLGRLQVPADAPEIAPILNAGVRFMSVGLPKDASTYIPTRRGPLLLTHIGASGGFEKNYLEGSFRIHSLPALIPQLSPQEIVKTITDHNPVTAAFQLSGTN